MESERLSQVSCCYSSSRCSSLDRQQQQLPPTPFHSPFLNGFLSSSSSSNESSGGEEDDFFDHDSQQQLNNRSLHNEDDIDTFTTARCHGSREQTFSDKRIERVTLILHESVSVTSACSLLGMSESDGGGLITDQSISVGLKVFDGKDGSLSMIRDLGFFPLSDSSHLRGFNPPSECLVAFEYCLVNRKSPNERHCFARVFLPSLLFNLVGRSDLSIPKDSTLLPLLSTFQNDVIAMAIPLCLLDPNMANSPMTHGDAEILLARIASEAPQLPSEFRSPECSALVTIYADKEIVDIPDVPPCEEKTSVLLNCDIGLQTVSTADCDVSDDIKFRKTDLTRFRNKKSLKRKRVCVNCFQRHLAKEKRYFSKVLTESEIDAVKDPEVPKSHTTSTTFDFRLPLFFQRYTYLSSNSANQPFRPFYPRNAYSLTNNSRNGSLSLFLARGLSRISERLISFWPRSLGIFSIEVPDTLTV